MRDHMIGHGRERGHAARFTKLAERMQLELQSAAAFSEGAAVQMVPGLAFASHAISASKATATAPSMRKVNAT
jgi:hypothetical protein